MKYGYVYVDKVCSGQDRPKQRAGKTNETQLSGLVKMYSTDHSDATNVLENCENDEKSENNTAAERKNTEPADGLFGFGGVPVDFRVGIGFWPL